MVLIQDGGQVVGRVGYREGLNDLEVMQAYSDDLILGANNVDRMWVKSNGFVGVGRESRITGAEVFGIHSDAASGFAGMYISTAGNIAAPFYGYSAGGDVDAYHYLDGASGKWLLVNGGGARIAVDPTGNVGFGTTVPVYPVHVEADGPDYPLFVSSDDCRAATFSEANNFIGIGVWGQGNGQSSTGVFGQSHGPGSTYGVRGSVSSSSGRGVAGSANAASGINYGVWGSSASPTGYDFYAAGAGINYGSSSSLRWKHNIENIDYPLEKIARIRGVTFDWDEEHGGHHDVGFIAEEVGEVLPEIVVYEDNGIDAQGMDYSKLTPLLVEAVNALRAENEALQARLDQMESQLRNLTIKE